MIYTASELCGMVGQRIHADDARASLRPLGVSRLPREGRYVVVSRPTLAALDGAPASVKIVRDSYGWRIEAMP